MRFIQRKYGRIIFLGLTVYKVKVTAKAKKIYVLGLRIATLKSPWPNVGYEKYSQNFDTRDCDQKLTELLSGVNVVKGDSDSNCVGIIATELYSNGGHTKCVRDLVKSLYGHYDLKIFMSREDDSSRAINELKCFAEMKSFGVTDKFKKDVLTIAQAIVNSKCKTLFAYIHPDDIIGAGVLSVLRNCGIKILFFNHASHYPCLGMSYADLILEGLPYIEKFTHEKRGLTNTVLVGLQSVAAGDTKYIDATGRNNLKMQMGVPAGAPLLMSGGASYKFFEKDMSSPYFEMIHRILIKETDAYQVVMGSFSEGQLNAVKKIFGDDSDVFRRLVIYPFQSDFDSYFQCADVFVDSFPVSSALTQIDLMRNKVVSVVKINRTNPEFSFHEYQMADYPYMFENVADMESCIIELLHSPKKREEIIERNYEFWLKTYESKVFRDKVIKLIALN